MPDSAAGLVSGLAVSGESSLRFELDAAHPDLTTFDPSEPLDLHALLAWGSVVLRSGDAELSLSSGRPILTVMRLMDEVERLIRDLDARRKPTAVRGQKLLTVSMGPSPRGALWLTPLSVVWRPEHPATALRTVRLAKPPPSLEVHLSPLELVALTAGLAEAICGAFVQANGALEGAARLADLRARGAALQGKIKARLTGSVSLDAPDKYLEARSDTRRVYTQSVAARPGQFPLDAMRRVSMRVRWSHTAQGIDWGAIWLDAERAVVPSDAGIVALALEAGQPLFELLWTPGERPSMVRDGWVAAALHPDGRLQGLDLREGRVLWTQPTPSGWGRLVDLSRFDGARGRWWVIAADGGFCAIDPVSGAVVWRGPKLLEALSGVQARGAVLSVGTDAGLLVGLDPVTGGVLWRTRAGAGRVRWLGGSEDGRWGWAVGADETGEASLWGVDRFEGRVKWRCALPGRPVGALIRGGRAVISLMGASAVSVDLTAGAVVWEQPLSGLQLAGPTAPLALDDARVLIKTDDGELWALDAESGARVWRTRLGGEGEALFRNAALQILDGVIVAAGSEVVLIDPSGGQVLHRLGELDGRPAWLRALPGPRLLVGDDDLGDDPATLSCYGAAHFLALVTAPR